MSRRGSATAIVVLLLPIMTAPLSRVGRVEAATGGRVHLVSPYRALDTRGGSGATPSGPTTGPVQLPGLSTVSALGGASPAVVATGPCSDPASAIPTATVDAHGQAVFTVVGDGSPTCLWATSPVDVVVDARGWIGAQPTADGLQYLAESAPRPILERDVDVTSQGTSISATVTQLPAATRALVLSLDAIGPEGQFVSVAGAGEPPLAVQGVSTVASETRHNTVIVAVPGGAIEQALTVKLWSAQTSPTHVRVTLLGVLGTDGPDSTRVPPMYGLVPTAVPPPGLNAITPTRVLDTRDALHPVWGLPAGQVMTLALGPYDPTGNARAAVLNVTATDVLGDGFLTVYPCGEDRPTAASLTYHKDETISNQVVVALPVDDQVCVFSYATVNIVVDLEGTFDQLSGAGIHPVTPERLLDTRIPIGVPTPGKLAAGSVLRLAVAGQHGVPTSGVDALTMNVTVTEPDGPGFVTAYPCDQPRPTAASLTYAAHETIPNLVTVKLAADGTVCLFSYATAHLVADLSAWYSLGDDDGYEELSPDRLLDTRAAIGSPGTAIVPTGGILALQVAGRSGVPDTGATAVTMNVSVTQPVGPGFVTAYPCDQPRPVAANLTYTAGQTISNLVTVKLSPVGTVCLYAMAGTHLVADVAGYFTAVPEGALLPTLIE